MAASTTKQQAGCRLGELQEVVTDSLRAELHFKELCDLYCLFCCALALISAAGEAEDLHGFDGAFGAPKASVGGFPEHGPLKQTRGCGC